MELNRTETKLHEGDEMKGNKGKVIQHVDGTYYGYVVNGFKRTVVYIGGCETEANTAIREFIPAPKFTDVEWSCEPIGNDSLCITAGRGEEYGEPVSHLATMTNPGEFGEGVQLANCRIMTAGRELLKSAIETVSAFRGHELNEVERRAIELLKNAIHSAIHG